MPKIFLLGATGHIGGAVLDLIVSTYSNAVDIKVLVRDRQKSDQLTSEYQYITSTIGNLDDLDLLESESRDADIVISTFPLLVLSDTSRSVHSKEQLDAGPDVTHGSGIRSILKGLSGRKEKGFYIHTSGAALIFDKSDGSKAGTTVCLSEGLRTYWLWRAGDDVADIKTLVSMPEGSVHMAEDKAVFAGSPDVNVAIISPTIVYGLSPSPIHPFPLTLPEILKSVRGLSSGFSISSGKNLQAYVHVMDLARLYLILLSHALGQPHASIEPQPELEIWGPEAYYFGEQEELSFGEFMGLLIPVLKKHGEVRSDDIREVDFNAVAEAMGVTDGPPVPDSRALQFAIMFGTNMRVRSSRARALGWKPQESGVAGTLDEFLGKYLESEKRG
ncbi:hypothetical protein LSUE1_G001655 [Lachnellula suecica]|uniref:Uncharacterized protein n=1 Tax=Lachnellula suecica TaxID=602035 RepID=A0A8T9CG15_9HELO|nr:hypothetical protein LSUE1_G001655 [Lachnellula suecica]